MTTPGGEDASPRGRVLAAVEEAGRPVTSTALSETLGLHPSTVRFHLRTLVGSGHVVESTADPSGPGRPSKNYSPAPPRPADRLLAAFVEVLLGDWVGHDDDGLEPVRPDAAEVSRRAASVGRAWAAQVLGDEGGAPAADSRTAAGSGAGSAGGSGGGSSSSSDAAVPHALADPVEAACVVLTALGFEITAANSIFGVHDVRVCSCPLRSIGARDPAVARGIQRGAVEYALARAAPGLSTAYEVDPLVDPRFGDCQVTLRIRPAERAASAISER